MEGEDEEKEKRDGKREALGEGDGRNMEGRGREGRREGGREGGR